jgi:hypothetical protein
MMVFRPGTKEADQRRAKSVLIRTVNGCHRAKPGLKGIRSVQEIIWHRCRLTQTGNRVFTLSRNMLRP